jgi:hypothetical protein
MIPKKRLEKPRKFFMALYDNNLVKKINDYFIPADISDTYLNSIMHEARLLCQKRLMAAFITFGVTILAFELSTIVFITTLMIAIFFVLSYFFLIIRINNHVQQQRVELEKTIPLLRLELRFLLKIMNEENDILKIFIGVLHSLMNEPGGIDHRALNFQLMRGQLPEMILKEFKSPSKKLDAFLHACHDINNLDSICNEKESFQQYKVFLKTLESRLVIFVAEGIFLPILTTLVYIFGMVPIPLHFVLLFMHFLILKYFASILLKKQFSLLYYTDIYSGKDSKILDDFIDVLGTLGNNIKLDTLELGFFKLFSQIHQKTLSRLGVTIQKNIHTLDFSQFFEEIELKSNSGIVRLISSMILHLKCFAGEHLANLIINFTTELKRQRELEDEKNDIILAERFKIKMIIIFIPFILSILTVLFQVMMIPDTVMNSGSASVISSQSSLFNGILLIFLNSSYNCLSCYYLTRISGIISCKKYAAVSTILFFLLYIMIFVSLPAP